ncbi:MAG: rhamnulokinase [Oscillospiraceae bacterium]|nr:rhamnulokinase [Oscillospiraceae bacterium]
MDKPSRFQRDGMKGASLMSRRVLAFDLGASGGRAMAASYENGKISIEEIHRFPNDPVMMRGVLYWDFPRLLHEVKQGIVKARGSGGFDSIGIDTWGVDFGLLDKWGGLLQNPVHYRDGRYSGWMKKACDVITPEKLYASTGIQFMDINTVSQLFYLKNERPDILERAETLLFMPDLIAYMLTGEKRTEYTIASTGQLLDAGKRDWAWDIIGGLDLPPGLFTQIIEPGTVSGRLSREICEELGVPPVPIIAVGEHDTASAIAAVPADRGDFAYISCGTWSLFGTELLSPLTDEKAFAYNITNEGGVGGTVRFLKNIIGLWLIQESRRQWAREGRDYSYAAMEKAALSAPAFGCFIDPDDPVFASPGDIPGRVREYCAKAGQRPPQTDGEVIRCIYESIAMKYRHTLAALRDCTGKSYPVIHLVGGGARDSLLCQMTANACNVPVAAGPVEATVLGNAAVQLIASGDIPGIWDARKIIAASHPPVIYGPVDAGEWDKAVYTV